MLTANAHARHGPAEVVPSSDLAAESREWDANGRKTLPALAGRKSDRWALTQTGYLPMGSGGGAGGPAVFDGVSRGESEVSPFGQEGVGRAGTLS